MSVSIRDVKCRNCGDHTPHSIFSSMLGKLFKCLVCGAEHIEEEDTNGNYRK